MTNGLMKSRNCKLKLFSNYQKTPTKENYDSYLSYRKIYNKLIKSAKEKYFIIHHYFEANHSNTNKIWKGTKSLLGFSSKSQSSPTQVKVGNRTVTGRGAMANAFDEYFTSIGTLQVQMRDKLPQTLSLKPYSTKFPPALDNIISKW